MRARLLLHVPYRVSDHEIEVFVMIHLTWWINGSNVHAVSCRTCILSVLAEVAIEIALIYVFGYVQPIRTMYVNF